MQQFQETLRADGHAGAKLQIGEDVTQLNHDLVDLGYANSSDINALGWDYYSWETQYAVEQMEEDLGVSSPSGSLSLDTASLPDGVHSMSPVVTR